MQRYNSRFTDFSNHIVLRWNFEGHCSICCINFPCILQTLPFDNSLNRSLFFPDVVSAVRNQVQSKEHSRLFAVVHMNSKQFKITEGDLILLHTNDVFPDVGERIVLEKVRILILYW